MRVLLKNIKLTHEIIRIVDLNKAVVHEKKVGNSFTGIDIWSGVAYTKLCNYGVMTRESV